MMNVILLLVDFFRTTRYMKILVKLLLTLKILTRGINQVFLQCSVGFRLLRQFFKRFIYLAPLRLPWKGLIEIFESETWLLLIVTLFIAGVSWFIFGKALTETNSHKKLALCVMNSLAVILGISSNNRPDYTPLRIFFIFLALYGLNVTTIYTSKLITVFTEPAHDQQISTITEILDAGIPIGITTFTNGEGIFFFLCICLTRTSSLI